MSRALRLAVAPRWLVSHLLIVAVCASMVLLGQWQWRVAHVRHGAIQNYAYAFQWWAFTVFALVMWARILRDAYRGRPSPPPAAAVPAAAATPVQEPVSYRRYVPPTQSAGGVDPERAAYNDYLARLAEDGA